MAASLSVKLDLGALHGLTPEALPATPRSLWRYRALMPVTAEPVSLGEGATPLIHLDRLGRRLGFPRLYAKDESQNPTWSYKDRLCSVAVTHAVQTGAKVVTISSTGNHGASTAAYAARAGLPCVIFTLASVPDTMKTLMQAYGAAVVACATSEARWALMRQGIERFGWYPTSGFQAPPVGSNPYGVDGYKTIAYEIAEDLGWMAPDVVVVPSAYSDGLFGVWKGFLGDAGARVRQDRAAHDRGGAFRSARARHRARLDAPGVVEGGSSVAFSIASRYGTYQGLAASSSRVGWACAHRRRRVRGAARARAGGRPLRRSRPRRRRSPPSCSCARRKRIDPEQTIVIVLTSGGLKDPAREPHVDAAVPTRPARLRRPAARACVTPMDWRWTASLGVALCATTPRPTRRSGRARRSARVSEACGSSRTTFTPAPSRSRAAGAVTERITIGLGVVNPYTRHPALLAMETAALAGIAPGRVVLGLGSSNRKWIEEQMAIPFKTPLDACARHGIVRRLLDGQRVTFAGDVFSIHGSPSRRCRWPPCRSCSVSKDRGPWRWRPRSRMACTARSSPRRRTSVGCAQHVERAWRLQGDLVRPDGGRTIATRRAPGRRPMLARYLGVLHGQSILDDAGLGPRARSHFGTRSAGRARRARDR